MPICENLWLNFTFLLLPLTSVLLWALSCPRRLLSPPDKLAGRRGAVNYLFVFLFLVSICVISVFRVFRVFRLFLPLTSVFLCVLSVFLSSAPFVRGKSSALFVRGALCETRFLSFRLYFVYLCALCPPVCLAGAVKSLLSCKTPPLFYNNHLYAAWLTKEEVIQG